MLVFSERVFDVFGCVKTLARIHTAIRFEFILFVVDTVYIRSNDYALT